MNDVASFLILYNPVAGSGRAGRVARDIAALLQRAGRIAHLRETHAPGDAERAARAAVDDLRPGGPLAIVACGGDGTVQEIANAVADAPHDRAVMGLAPAGRCNDFARALGVGMTPESIVDALTASPARPVDLGRIGDRYFCTVAATGFDAAVSRFVNDMRMPLRGPAAYVYGTLRVLLRYRTPVLRLSGDFGRYEGPVFFAASANTALYGGAMRIAPGASAFDGRLDVCLVTRTTRRRVLRMLSRVMSGRHVDLPEVRILRTRRLTVEPVSDADTVEVWADGEPIARPPVTIESVAAAVPILLPHSAETDSASPSGLIDAIPLESESTPPETVGRRSETKP